MINIRTPRIKLFPLSKHQLFEFIHAPEKLEEGLSFPISHSVIDANLKNSISKKLEKMQKSKQSDHLWQTYWLLQTLEPSFGVGLLGFKELPDANGRVEIRCNIDQSVRGQGLMSEAVAALCEWALEQANCSLITATSDHNPTSMSVFEKSGFRLMGHNPVNCLWHRYKTGFIIITPGDNRKFEPIGIIHTGYENAAGTPIQPNAAQESFGTIILRPELASGLKDLEAFSHIVLLYVFDRIRQFKLIVKPFMDDDEHGVFATRAPARPNPIGLSVVRLLKIEQNLISFSGADMLNNTPLLDVKPYAPAFEPASVERIGWLEKRIDGLQKSSDDGRFLSD